MDSTGAIVEEGGTVRAASPAGEHELVATLSRAGCFWAVPAVCLQPLALQLLVAAADRVTLSVCSNMKE